MTKKRSVYAVRWMKFPQRWGIFGPDHVIIESHKSKSEAVRYGAGLPRDAWHWERELGQLRVFNKNGKIAFERSYGKDPARYKG